MLRQPITAVIEDQEARDAAALSAEAGASKPSWPLPMTSHASTCKERIEQVKTEASERRLSKAGWIQTLRTARPKVAVVEAQLAKATTNTKRQDWSSA